MAQISSNKIVSLHLQKCSGHCPNASVCYHMKKDVGEDYVIDQDKIRRIISKYFKVHESVCHYQHQYHKKLLMECPTYNITVSCKDIPARDGDLLSRGNQIQVSVYSKQDVWEFAEYQKLFLIKDDQSLMLAYELMKMVTGKLHFILTQDFIVSHGFNPSRKIINFIREFEHRVDKNQSADTCLTSWIINGKCPYNSSNYIDLNHDATIRKCPYAKESLATIDGTEDSLPEEIEESFFRRFVPDCVYTRIFQGDIDGRISKDSSLQNSSSNNGDGGNTKRMRRLSLRG